MSDLRLYDTADGSHSLFSERFGVTYHSKYGAIQETQHVFINKGLRYKAVVQRDIAVLDIGMGTGLNAFMTLLEAEKRDLHVTYVGVEAYPPAPEILARLNYVAELQVPQYDAAFTRLHTLAPGAEEYLTPHFRVLKLRRAIESVRFKQAFDLIYFDAFAPEAQPELWTKTVLQRMYQALQPGGALLTYCAKGVVKRTLRSVGFEVESLKGPPGKREMTRALRLG